MIGKYKKLDYKAGIAFKVQCANLVKELTNEEIVIRARGYKTIGEKIPGAYKDVSDIIEVMHNEGIRCKVAQTKPIGVIEGS